MMEFNYVSPRSQFLDVKKISVGNHERYNIRQIIKLAELYLLYTQLAIDQLTTIAAEHSEILDNKYAIREAVSRALNELNRLHGVALIDHCAQIADKYDSYIDRAFEATKKAILASPRYNGLNVNFIARCMLFELLTRWASRFYYEASGGYEPKPHTYLTKAMIYSFQKELSKMKPYGASPELSISKRIIRQIYENENKK